MERETEQKREIKTERQREIERGIRGIKREEGRERLSERG